MPIQVLPPQLASQIAAGEMVERPSSVVKELVENSIDAGATRIDIDIEKGGKKLIRIRDNGCGIRKDELVMALARHATSKITTLSDLEAIISLGFRGEALASIRSVSRLTLISRPAEQSEAWQAYEEGRHQSITIKPAAHPVGTTLEVLDLFYNTPARRKFMRTEKTEYTHINEVIRRIALAYFDVTISLNHNGKLMRQYRCATSKDSQRERRLMAICGAAFLSHALKIEWHHGELSLHGWVVDPTGSKSLNGLQYCYVNGRMVRDRFINHAIRQAYQDKLDDQQQPAYVLYLEIEPHQVDVNVHPAKHEVRFHQSRLVHDFIYQGIVCVLQKIRADILPKIASGTILERCQSENRQAAGSNCFSKPALISRPAFSGNGRKSRLVDQKCEGTVYQRLKIFTTVPATVSNAESVQSPVKPLSSGYVHSFGHVLSLIEERFALIEDRESLALIALPVAERWLKQAYLDPGEKSLKTQTLLIPLRLKMDKAELIAASKHIGLLSQMGINLMIETNHVMLRGVPLPLRQQNLQNLIPKMLGYLGRHEHASAHQMAQWLACQLVSEYQQWNHARAVSLLAEVGRLCPHLVQSPPSDLLQKVSLESAMTALNHV